jgi:hypothetical protein
MRICLMDISQEINSELCLLEYMFTMYEFKDDKFFVI